MRLTVRNAENVFQLSQPILDYPTSNGRKRARCLSNYNLKTSPNIFGIIFAYLPSRSSFRKKNFYPNIAKIFDD